jgi:hypothetical protein
MKNEGGWEALERAHKLWCLDKSIQIIEAYAASAAAKGNLAAVMESVYNKLCELRQDADGGKAKK